jgi:hypothetical protein
VKINILAPIAVLVAGIFLLFGGDAVASSEESIANATGSLIQNKWLAAGLLVAGGLWLYSTTGHFKSITA